MQQQEYFDFLTGFNLRHTLLPTLERLLSLAAIDKQSVAVAIVDIDLFKQINDKFGHISGDEAIQYIARTLRSLVGVDDTCFRYGGDEFIIIFGRKTSADVAKILGAYYRLAAEQPFLCQGRPRRLTISCGVAEYPRDGKAAEELLRRADKALYFSKRCGRRHVTESRRLLYLKVRNFLLLVTGLVLLIAAPLVINRIMFKGKLEKLISKLLEFRVVIKKGTDTVVLSNGGTLYGFITSETNDTIVLDLDLGEKQLSTITLKKSEIQRIERW